MKVVSEEVCYATKELNEFANPFKQNSGDYLREWTLRGGITGKRSIETVPPSVYPVSKCVGAFSRLMVERESPAHFGQCYPWVGGSGL